MFALETVDFGLGAAQQEQHLDRYFYRSGSFQLASSDKVYLILGAKGAGKSAIFRMLESLHNEIPAFQAPNLWIIEEPQLREHWATLHKCGIESEVTLWRFYIASLIAEICLKCPDLPDELQKNFKRFLVRWGLVSEVPTAWQAIKRTKLTVGFGDYIKTEFPPKSPLAATEIDYILNSASIWLEERSALLWLCLDSLDETAIDGYSQKLTEDLLSNLMRAIGELIRLKQIRFKLFFRSDIYQSLTYVNKDHFSAVKLELRWPEEDLAIMLAHRIRNIRVNNTSDLNYSKSIELINNVFDWSTHKHPKSFNSLYNLLKDGNETVLPRDLINFCIASQNQQMTYNIQGINKPKSNKLISESAIRAAIKCTAESKLSDFLQVFQNFSQTYSQLKGSPTSLFSREDLAIALGKSPLDANFVISDLVRVGALAIKDKKAVNQAQTFEVPFLYSLGLGIGDHNDRI